MAMDMLSDNIRDRKLWEIMFAADLVKTAELKEELQRRVFGMARELREAGIEC